MRLFPTAFACLLLISASPLEAQPIRFVRESLQFTLAADSFSFLGLYYFDNPSTTIIFDLPTAGKVTLQIYDALGREVAELVHGFRPPGQYRAIWSGRDDHGIPVGSVIYLARRQLTGADGEPSVEKAIKLLLVR